MAVSVPRRHGQGLQFHAVCGAQYSTEVQQRPLTATSQRDHQHTDLAGATAKRPAAPLVRDEEAQQSQAIGPSAAAKKQTTSLGHHGLKARLADVHVRQVQVGALLAQLAVPLPDPG